MTRKPNPYERRPGLNPYEERPQWYAAHAPHAPHAPRVPAGTRTRRNLAVGAALAAGLLAAAVLLAKPIMGALGLAVFVVLLLTGNASS
ncbi:hypothetical protein [Streptomyces aureoverticillatus]|uniref:hypothetical protein n=1 Tax=Streptomyces aureoverticillatus TaxID=66871 RepID=UPI0013DA4464|nr:hypothetical protein [Streptomyces aureoverticillatus]QIB45082.1 hypothetical protein G3H79_20420 [Streptomyces aureoverticillatus]